MEIENGIYYNMPGSDYYASQVVSNSYLTRLKKCPAEARIPYKDTAAMKFGRAAHVYVLEGVDVFDRQFVAEPQINKRTNYGKAELEVFKAEVAVKGLEIIHEKDIESIKRMSEGVHSHPVACNLLSAGKSEVSVFWIDTDTGLQCKSRIDWIPDGNRKMLVDLKTTRDAASRKFGYSVRDYSYDKQAAMYLWGYNQVVPAEEQVDLFVFIAVETVPPYHVEVYVLSPEKIKQGFEDFTRLIQLEKTCQDRNFWPNYNDSDPVEI